MKNKIVEEAALDERRLKSYDALLQCGVLDRIFGFIRICIKDILWRKENIWIDTKFLRHDNDPITM